MDRELMQVQSNQQILINTFKTINDLRQEIVLLETQLLNDRVIMDESSKKMGELMSENADLRKDMREQRLKLNQEIVDLRFSMYKYACQFGVDYSGKYKHIVDGMFKDSEMGYEGD